MLLHPERSKVVSPHRFHPFHKTFHKTTSRVATVLGVAMLLLAAVWFALPGRVPRALAQESQTAKVLVQFGDQARVIRSIEFTSPLSGLTALQWSGLDVVYTDTAFGPAVCSIEGVGCPASDCFCNSKYWSYNYWDGAAWQSYSGGVGSSVISQSGSIEGWHWGEFGDLMVDVSPTLAAERALTWLQARQVITNGSYGNVAGSLESLLAIGANHIPADEWRASPSAPSLASYIILNAANYTKAAAGAAGKTAVALSAGEVCLPAGAQTPQDHFSATLGTYVDQSGPNSWAILGAVAVSESVPTSAINGLRAGILPEGGWEWAPGWGADTNSTALAIQALIATGDPITSTAVLSGLAYLSSTQNADGGFPYAAGPEAGSDTNSTAYVVQSIIAAGQDPAGPTWTISNSNPISYLLSMQLANGSFEWQPTTGENQFATVQAIPALLGQINPAALRELAACPAAYLPAAIKSAE
jgi:hypothetical protein